MVTKEQVQGVPQKFLVDAMDRDEEQDAFLGEKQAWKDGTWTIQHMDVGGAE